MAAEPPNPFPLSVECGVFEAEDLETRLLYSHAHLENTLRTIYRRLRGEPAPLCGEGVDLEALESALGAAGHTLDPVPRRQLRVFRQIWSSFLDHMDLCEYNDLLPTMPYEDRYGFSQEVHREPEVREIWLELPDLRFLFAFKDLYTYLRLLADTVADATVPLAVEPDLNASPTRRGDSG